MMRHFHQIFSVWPTYCVRHNDAFLAVTLALTLVGQTGRTNAHQSGTMRAAGTIRQLWEV